jgi:murein DD-endopeptidase MepM/ murein hydrolase activator NlpD
LDEQHNELSRQKKDNENLLAATQRREDKYQELIGESADQQRKLAQEIQALETELLQKHQGTGGPGGPPVTGAGLFREPMTGALGAISQSYGLTNYAKTGVYGYNSDGTPRIHAGVDFALPCGTAVTAVADGEVFGQGSLNYGFGNWVVLFHPKLNLYTLYGHLSRSAVAAGQILKQGDIVGFEGTSGFSTGCHLHLGVYLEMAIVKTSYGESPWYAPEKTINPIGLF